MEGGEFLVNVFTARANLVHTLDLAKDEAHEDPGWMTRVVKQKACICMRSWKVGNLFSLSSFISESSLLLILLIDSFLLLQQNAAW